MKRHPKAAPLTEEEIAAAQREHPIRRIKPARKTTYAFRSQAGFGVANIVARAAASVPDPEEPKPAEPEAEET